MKTPIAVQLIQPKAWSVIYRSVIFQVAHFQRSHTKRVLRYCIVMFQWNKTYLNERRRLTHVAVAAVSVTRRQWTVICREIIDTDTQLIVMTSPALSVKVTTEQFVSLTEAIQLHVRLHVIGWGLTFLYDRDESATAMRRSYEAANQNVAVTEFQTPQPSPIAVSAVFFTAAENPPKKIPLAKNPPKFYGL